MAAIPCVDYLTDPVPTVPTRIDRTNPDALFNRWANFIFSMDLSPDQKDETGAGVGAWSLWDIPSSHCAQIDDDRGEDLICLAILNNVFYLDQKRFQDEWVHNGYAPINRLIRIGPLPSSDQTTIPTGGYDLSTVKRFREFEFSLKDGALGTPAAIWHVTVGEWDHEEQTSRTSVRRTTGRMRTRVSTKGRSFIITIEHSANEPIHIEHWRAAWDMLGHRIRQAGIQS